MSDIQSIRAAIRDIPDFPKKGIIFKDITTLINNADLFRKTVDRFIETLSGIEVDYIAGIEARGFIFGSAIALKAGCGFVPIRKPGKLPGQTFREEYALEYGSDAVEIHQDAFPNGKNVLLVDDLLATGGTALAAARLIEKCGGKVAGIRFLIELDFLSGINKFKNYQVSSLIHF
jgi:adenine phosphoribosyltransferase